MTSHKSKIFFGLFLFVLFFGIYFLDILAGPFIISFILSYLLNPLFERLEKRGIKRVYSALFFVSFFSLLISYFIKNLIPLFFNQMNALLADSLSFKAYLDSIVLPKISDVISSLTGKQHTIKSFEIYEAFSFDIKYFQNSFLTDVGHGTKYVASKFIVFLMFPFFMFFLMRDLVKIYHWILSLVPYDVQPTFLQFVSQVNLKLTNVLRGQFFVILILCVLYPSAFMIAGLPSAMAVGAMVGVARIVPYMDIVTGLVLMGFTFVTTNADSHLIIASMSAFLTVQCLDAFVITPRIMGKFSGLHPFFVILSVICFGNWFGFWGVLLAVPSAAILKVAFTMMINTYKESDFFKDGNK